ncbi:hypothetical protein G3I71_16010 [Streptomyces sp. SID12501]|uniref:Uncharacterized protein n=1 Tax=Streptomyces sp. SID12501 TaxID=2706042 RepID=A0A6B3BSK8_9ACTN|nr:hypothetical protein [Streptomyces sp. SID12501]NEC87292.1 hypothetical protein [Streptomyces sp. SID12501]
MFEAWADEFAVPVPDTDVVHTALSAAVRKFGPARVDSVTAEFVEMNPRQYGEVALCWVLAYRLALSFWYEGARSRPMTVGEAAVALYLSDAYRHQVDPDTFRRSPLLVSRAIRQGAALVPTETLMRLGAAMGWEFVPALTCVTPGVTDASHQDVTAMAPGRDWLYRQALPDWRRRRFCFDLMRADRRQPSPLIVRLDGGGYEVGATPPAGPDGTWTRSLRAQW